jgi:uncharacterized protein (DUF58 family)
VWGSDKSLPTKADRGRVLTLAIANLLMKGGERCALIGLQDRARSGRIGFERLAESMMRAQTDERALETDIAAHSRFIIVSDFLDPIDEWRKRLSRLSGRPVTGVMVQIIDPAEEAFPYKGRLNIRAPGGARQFLLGRAESAREAYQSRLAEHNTKIANTASRLGWTLIRHRTNEPATLALNALYQAMSGDQ